jgi:hypothetical protein
LSEPGAVAVGGGIGWLLGGPVGAAVVGSISYLLNKNIQKQDDKQAKESYHQQIAQLCITATEDYLSHFSSEGLTILADYEQRAKKIIRFKVSEEPQEISNQRKYLQQLQNSFNFLLQELGKVSLNTNYQPYREILKCSNTNREYFPQIETVQTSSSQNIFNKQRQENTVNNKTEKKVESPRQQVSSPPPPKAVPSPSREEVEAKFFAWELDEEIARMKSEMRSPASQAGKKQDTNQSNKVPNQPKNQAEKDKITRAYSILGLQSSASLVEVKQAYRSLVKKWHPDLFVNQPQLQKQAQDKMHLFNEAYTLLSDKFN